MSQPAFTSRPIIVDHMRIASGKPFEEVRRALEESVPKLDPAIQEILRQGDAVGADAYDGFGPTLSIFLIRDHGALLEIVGAKRNALQYEIGNPLTASKMTRHQLAAALYAPLRIVLYEDDEGRGVFEYDRPSSLFGQIGDDRVTDVSLGLDTEIEAALRKAAGL